MVVLLGLPMAAGAALSQTWVGRQAEVQILLATALRAAHQFWVAVAGAQGAQEQAVAVTE